MDKMKLFHNRTFLTKAMPLPKLSSTTAEPNFLYINVQEKYNKIKKILKVWM
jgi:hypothetical protein